MSMAGCKPAPAAILQSTSVSRKIQSTTTDLITSPEEKTIPVSAKRRKPNASVTYHTSTLRAPQWTYFHLRLITSSQTSAALPIEEPSLDALSVRRYLNAALSRFLGLMGISTPIDILKIDQQDVWIRVPRDDATAVHEAVSSWLSNPGGMANGNGTRWIVKGRDDWLVRLHGGTGQDLFTA